MRQDGFTATDGTPIAYYDWPGDADAPPVLLHHGFVADTASNWVDTGVVAALTAAGRRVVGMDARGHGASGKSGDPARYGEATMARDLMGLIDELSAPAVHLVGYSMGAVVALIAATRDARITRVVAGGVGSGVVEVGGVDTRAGSAELITAALTAPSLAEAPPATRPFRALADALGSDLPSLAAQASALHRKPLDLAGVRVPTLVLAGVDDPLATRPGVLAEAVAQGALRVVAGDHLTATRDPQFTAAIVDFLTVD
ncbi:alpha/beta fold hydrolase [Actinokineospora pegani]|uniref:alpha/beta fold hydrolase n=1 Tax=Actinokineospora pegani TaxID=2654637 RepID=UPI0012E9D5D1|nr:alpha/beta hydrolase [Actinokineospora pegani]